MRAIASAVLSVVAGLAVYAGLFIFAVKKPLTVGFMHDALTVKRDYARRIETPKVVIVGGSSSLYSLSCSVMEPILKRPCVNAAITEALGLEYTLEIGRRLSRPGDLIIMSLEYGYYIGGEIKLRRGRLHPFRVTYDRAALWQLPSADVVQAVFQFDLRYLIGAGVEMGMAAANVLRRFSAKILTPNGDMFGHTAEKATRDHEPIGRTKFWLSRETRFRIHPMPRRILGTFNDWARSHDLTVVGTLPATFDDRPYREAMIRRIADLFRADSQHFMALANRHQYPRACFYDSQYHLNETCQIEHSRRFAEALIRLPAFRAAGH